MKYNKYGNKKTVVDGIKFDSKKEAAYYQELKLRKRARDIIDFELQPKFTLQPSFKKDGKTIRAITYTADFIVYSDGKTEIVDVKASKFFQTNVFRIKWKMLQYKLRNDEGYTLTLFY